MKNQTSLVTKKVQLYIETSVESKRRLLLPLFLDRIGI